MPQATGIFKQVSLKREVSYGTIPAAAAAQLLRRVTSTIDLSKDVYQSNEIRPDFQIADYRHGVRRVKGKLSQDLQCRTFADFFGFALKRDFAAVTAITGASITIAGAGPTYTVTRAAGSWLTDAYKVGMVVRLSVGALNAANINKNLLITAIGSATVMTVLPLNGVALVAEGPIVTTTITAIGKVTYVPASGHTDKSFTVEHWYSDLLQSEVFSGCKIDQIAMALPPTGMATIDMDVIGQNITVAAAQYFTSPVAQTTTGVMAAVNGVCRVGGVTVASLTGLTLQIDPTYTGDPVVGSNTVPFQFPGRVRVTGQLTAYFDSITLRDAFINESEIDLIAAFTADNTPASDFIAIAIPRLKLGGAAKNDGEGGLIQTIPFMALLNVAGGAGIATEKTTIQIQDAQA